MHIEERHLKIVKDILQQYPYTFYAFGSRVTGRVKHLSDLDLCFFEPITSKDLISLEEAFEESDLPYKVDLVDWHKCDETFQGIIFRQMVCFQPSKQLLAIEQNAFEHFQYLPKVLGFKVLEDSETKIINSGLGSSMFNIACTADLAAAVDLDIKIKEMIHRFNHQPFAWWIGPSVSSRELSQKLIEQGFIVETTEYAMLCDLSRTATSTESPSELVIRSVLSDQQLQHFIEVLEPYDPASRAFYEKLNESMLQGKERLFVGYEKETPVIIATLFFGNNAAGIFNLITCEKKRGRGYGTAMMSFLLEEAKSQDVNWATLSASSVSGYRIYQRLGFRTLGQFESFEWRG